jgi:hypothetical protein
MIKNPSVMRTADGEINRSTFGPSCNASFILSGYVSNAFLCFLQRRYCDLINTWKQYVQMNPIIAIKMSPTSHPEFRKAPCIAKIPVKYKRISKT